MPPANPAPSDLERTRPVVAVVCALLGLAVVVAMHFLLPDELAKILIDRPGERERLMGSIYPFSVQNAMWIVFFIALGEVVIRLRVGNAELAQLGRTYLPEDSATMLRSDDLVPIYRRVRADGDARQRFLPRLIERAIRQFQSSRSVEQTNTLLHSSLDMYLHEVDLRYNILRYLAWLIPSLGFIGTVIGIGGALRFAGAAPPGSETLLADVTNKLGVSFNGTLVALVLAACVAFLTNIAQSREEQALNRAGQYCLDNLINRLYER
jgi:biopolymer transport protein ExbB/TolQ